MATHGALASSGWQQHALRRYWHSRCLTKCWKSNEVLKIIHLLPAEKVTVTVLPRVTSSYCKVNAWLLFSAHILSAANSEYAKVNKPAQSFPLRRRPSCAAGWRRHASMLECKISSVSSKFSYVDKSASGIFYMTTVNLVRSILLLALSIVQTAWLAANPIWSCSLACAYKQRPYALCCSWF